MQYKIPLGRLCVLSILSVLLLSCATTNSGWLERYSSNDLANPPPAFNSNYSMRIPDRITTNESVVVVDPRVHVWGAYSANGDLEKAGIASAGSDYCRDLGRRCHTRVGTFRVFSLGGPGCISHIFPIPRGGAPMPYCMYFNTGQALHGVPDYEVGEGNFSHGCVRLRVIDAEWLRYNFVHIGTKVIIQPY